MNFAVIGVGGYVAKRHLQAIKDTGNRVVAALDPSDSVGILDSYFPEARFFTEFERFDRHVEKLRRLKRGDQVHYVSICSPNYLHDAHIRFALRVGADVVCEKPVVLNPWNIEALRELEYEYKRRVNVILQLRHHPVILNLKKRDWSGPKPLVRIRYVTPRGNWYHASWKGDEEKSGGIITNIGVHLFDMLLWVFGGLVGQPETEVGRERATGRLELVHANVEWFLSTSLEDGRERSLLVNGNSYDFTSGFEGLHTKTYEEILRGNGHGLVDSKPAIELTYKLRKHARRL